MPAHLLAELRAEALGVGYQTLLIPSGRGSLSGSSAMAPARVRVPSEAVLGAGRG